MTDDPNRKVTTREWLLILFLVLLVQFIVQGSAFVYCNKGSALNYWSLVGTSVSIILALLAIIWSFIQNMVQQKGSSSIASQIERLQSVVLEASKSGVEFSGQVDRLNEVRTQLQETAELTRQSRADIADMGKRVVATQQLVESLTHKTSQPPPKPDDTVAKVFSDFYELSSLTGALSIYACYLSHKNKVAFDLSKICQAVQYLELPYAQGYLVASSSAGILEYTQANGIYNVTGFSEVVAADIRSKLLKKIEGFKEDFSNLAEVFTKNLKIVDSMLTT